MAAGAIPISELIATNSGGSASDNLYLLVTAVVVANIICIAAAGLLAFLGKRKPNMFKNFNGDGELAVGKPKLSVTGVGKPIDPADAIRSTIIGCSLPDRYSWSPTPSRVLYRRSTATSS
ncbi:2-hydroxycarboxylate transporter family protein [Rhodococcus sp. ARC_M12]|uniref:2-hydroxycarboxylate transporter family protein n=1 Tax=Rhodococcus sp. ARC_M12 TaxID=2928854 RepID=UPI001FB2561D|nr:2-hydroxycarboxylate transporter family protein [Rhodococcus sp. ARC_M12]MCJ0977447.1 2-hydroxycarboxylate transporter family protein [Rhodococcus sp. ARC_M12]